MVYIPANQTASYPHVKDHFKSTNQHFHDEPNTREPQKHSTFGKLYTNSVYFMDKRLEKKPTNPFSTTLEMGQKQDTRLNWSGKLPEASYVGNGTFQLANGLTYSYRSHKPVKLVPYAALTKTEYQDNYNRTAVASTHPGWVTGRAPYSVQYKYTGRFMGKEY